MHILIDDIYLNTDNFANEYVKLKPEFGQNSIILKFLDFWFNKKNYFIVFTSGTTSKPKEIKLTKNLFISSAVQTIDFLKLKNENIYCCIPIDKIGGLMMIVRALVGNFDIKITKPSADPMKELKPNHNYTFISLVPYQVFQIINNSDSLKKLMRFKTILIGGAEINIELLQIIETFKPDVYHTFGMSETCSNFALKKLNNVKWNYFKKYPEVNLRIDKDGVLSIKGNQTNKKWIKTNDIVKLYKDGFEFIGRNDFVINTGGYKISPEYLESKIEKILYEEYINIEFYISSVSSIEWGQMLVLVFKETSINNLDNIFNFFKSKLSKHEIPKKLIPLKDFPLNNSMKIDRIKLKEFISAL